jgi:diadenosine tetraphosphate (Ap4A) HIT family hydrolase
LQILQQISQTSTLSIEKVDTILHETKNFVVTPTVGSLVEGWLLIISKSHFVSGGQLEESYFKELQDLINLVRQRLENLQKQLFVFEHGPCSLLQTTGCGIDHLHFHIVPLDFNLFVKAKEYSPFSWSTANLLSTKKFFLKGLPYLYLECPSGKNTLLQT